MQSVFSRWLCGLLLCGAATVMAQTASGQVSAEDSSSSDSMVSGSVNSIDNSQLKQPSGGVAHGFTALRASDRLEIAALPNNNNTNARKKKSAASPHSGTEFGMPPLSQLGVWRLKNQSTFTNRKQAWAEADQDAADSAGSSDAADTAGSSETFPDSTRGTGIMNSDDAGNASPLEWSPGLHFGLIDFSERTFLSPTLHGGEHSKKRSAAHRATRLRSASILNRTPASGIPSFENAMPHTGVSSESGLHSSIADPLGHP
jgi:hypothetical protein